MSRETPFGDRETALKDEVKEPRLFKVLLFNDDYTTMDFVVEVLRSVFHKSESEAFAVMLAVHRTGFGVCGIYTAEVAETKVNRVHSLARKAGYPLKSGMEEV